MKLSPQEVESLKDPNDN